MDTAQWPQEMVLKPIEDIVVTKQPAAATTLERKPRPQKEQALNCPRCHSTNTKFCYYNNYSLTQPRYFCKTCRRYWTEGGTLRNIPVGGGSRKSNKRSSSNSNNNSSTTSCSSPPPLPPPNKKVPDLVSIQNPKVHDARDLNLTFDRNIMPELLVQQNNKSTLSPSISSTITTTSATNTTAASTSHHLSALELLTGITTTSGSRGLMSSFMPVHVPVAAGGDPNSVYTTCGYPFQDFIKPTLSFSLDGMIGGNLLHGSSSSLQENSGRLLFPFEDLKQVASTNMDHKNNNNEEQQHGDSNGGYWTGMLGEGGSW
ncbi:hypothetical protein RIF29_21738 [Crotalaria pallida]|uniref:Dof zinc finger protein n=1 Tax=Crotalaria pallida TaxID=3830 RepID=A0AAN9F7X2_CROPI